jgi:hypothetical protein
MAQIVTESISDRLFSPPSGQRKKHPTIFDELRWATEFSQNPLEQILQLISEFHGPWTGANTASNNLLNGSSSPAVLFDAPADYSPNQSTVGRMNNIIVNNMSTPLFREFIAKCQAIHPAINNFIQLNIGYYPFFQQISDAVGSFSQSTSIISEVKLQDRIQDNTSQRLRKSTSTKLFSPLQTMVEDSSKYIDVLFLRSMQPNNTSLQASNSGSAHGHNLMMDTNNQEREHSAIIPCVQQTVKRFGPTLQLCNSFFPLNYRMQNTPVFYNLSAEGVPYVADRLNRPITRDTILPVATDVKKSAQL